MVLKSDAKSKAAPTDGVAASTAVVPSADDVARWSDHYFLRTKEAIGRFGDVEVTYAVFMRRPVVFAPKLMLDWLQRIAEDRGVHFDITFNYDEGQWVGAGEPLLNITGSMYHLVDLETLYLQKLGAACVAANNAFTMCVELPDVSFLAIRRASKWPRSWLTPPRSDHVLRAIRSAPRALSAMPPRRQHIISARRTARARCRTR